MSASYLSGEERETAGIPDSLVRIPVGIERVDGLIANPDQALANRPSKATVTIKEINDNRKHYWQWQGSSQIQV